MVRQKNSLLWITICAIVVSGFFLSSCSEEYDPCLGEEPHPIAVNIAANYDADYAQIMDWYCAGSGFDDIILALETQSIMPEMLVEDMLQSIADGNTWDEIWNEIGITN